MKKCMTFFGDVPEAGKSRKKLLAVQCGLCINNLKLPRFDVPEGKTAPEYLREMYYDGFAMGYPTRSPMEGTARSNCIPLKPTGLCGYFLIVGL
ncbi:MAG: hypothetical protein V8Q36_10845 [Anaerotignum sp.]